LPAQLASILSGIDLHSARQRERFRHAGPISPRDDGKSSEMHLPDINERI
jgi:hypothetical protein